MQETSLNRFGKRRVRPRASKLYAMPGKALETCHLAFSHREHADAQIIGIPLPSTAPCMHALPCTVHPVKVLQLS
jgi:hypothetical protein